MKILCDRCKEKVTDYDDRKGWNHIETSKKSYGKLGDYYLCPECSTGFYDFLNKRAADERK